MLDWRGRPKGKAGPSTPAVVTGFKELPKFGDKFLEVADEKMARKMAALNANAEAGGAASANVTSGDLLRMMSSADNAQTFNVIVKGDVQGSVTSVVDNLKMIDTKGEVVLNVVASGVGDVSENDVYMAVGENTVIYGFNVGIPAGVEKIASRDGVAVRTYKVIYELLDDAKHEMEKLLPEEVVETEVGEMKVLGVFRTERNEVIAGGEVLTGKVVAGAKLRAVHEKAVIGEGEVVSVQKEKMDVKELVAGETGGLQIKTEHKVALAVGDRLKFFTRETKQKKL